MYGLQRGTPVSGHNGGISVSIYLQWIGLCLRLFLLIVLGCVCVCVCVSPQSICMTWTSLCTHVYHVLRVSLPTRDSRSATRLDLSRRSRGASLSKTG